MKKEEHLKYDVEEQFSFFIAQLQGNEALEWLWLLDEFRRVVFSWLRKKVNYLPQESVLSMEDFLEEVYAESLFRFYELFGKGSFENIQQLKALMFKIVDLKLKEGFRKIKKDYRLFSFSEDLQKISKQEGWQIEDKNKTELILKIKAQLNKLSFSERELLIQFVNGVELKQIAQNLGISASACRKRKERALSKLKALVWSESRYRTEST